jgi:hypothetical protein
LRVLSALAAAAAGAAALTASRPEPARAYSGGGDQQFLALGSNPWYIANSMASNTPATSSAPTVIQATPNYVLYLGTNGADPVLFKADASTSSGNIDGIRGIGAGGGNGVYGLSNSGNGVYGLITAGGGVGVLGQGGIGVQGQGIGSAANLIGVQGLGTYGVWGASGSGIGVYGTTTSSDNSRPAVQGTNFGPGPGVVGFSGTGAGVSGGTASGIGFGGIVPPPAKAWSARPIMAQRSRVSSWRAGLGLRATFVAR